MMLKLLFSPLGGYIAAGAVVFLIGFGWYWDHNGASRVQGRFDAYKVQAKMEYDAEQARQRAESAAAINGLQIQLDIAESEAAASEQAVDALRALVASRPLVPGRGATQEDIDVLNP